MAKQNDFIAQLAKGNANLERNLRGLCGVNKSFGKILERDFPALLEEKQRIGHFPGMEFLAKTFPQDYANAPIARQDGSTKTRNLTKAAEWRVSQAYNAVAQVFGDKGKKPYAPAREIVRKLRYALVSNTQGIESAARSNALESFQLVDDGADHVDALDTMIG